MTIRLASQPLLWPSIDSFPESSNMLATALSTAQTDSGTAQLFGCLIGQCRGGLDLPRPQDTLVAACAGSGSRHHGIRSAWPKIMDPCRSAAGPRCRRHPKAAAGHSRGRVAASRCRQPDRGDRDRPMKLWGFTPILTVSRGGMAVRRGKSLLSEPRGTKLWTRPCRDRWKASGANGWQRWTLSRLIWHGILVQSGEINAIDIPADLWCERHHGLQWPSWRAPVGQGPCRSGMAKQRNNPSASWPMSADWGPLRIIAQGNASNSRAGLRARLWFRAAPSGWVLFADLPDDPAQRLCQYCVGLARAIAAARQAPS